MPLTRFVLVDTSHAGNVGAAARAIKVMGFDDLVLVSPRRPDVAAQDGERVQHHPAGGFLEQVRGHGDV